MKQQHKTFDGTDYHAHRDCRYQQHQRTDASA